MKSEKFQATRDSILVEATLTSKAGTNRVYDVFVLREGKSHITCRCDVKPAAKERVLTH